MIFPTIAPRVWLYGGAALLAGLLLWRVYSGIWNAGYAAAQAACETARRDALTAAADSASAAGEGLLVDLQATRAAAQTDENQIRIIYRDRYIARLAEAADCAVPDAARSVLDAAVRRANAVATAAQPAD